MKTRQVFISYSHQDQEMIDKLANAVNNSKELIWLDRNFIMPGDVWRDKIEKALKNSYCVIFFASPSSIKSKEAKLEIDYAIKLRKKVIPVLLEKCDLPYEISNLHFVDLTKNTEQEVVVFKQILSGIASRKKNNLPDNKIAAGIVQEVRTSNNFYNTVIVPNRFLWTSTAFVFTIFLCLTFLWQNPSKVEEIEPDYIPDIVITQNHSDSTTSVAHDYNDEHAAADTIAQKYFVIDTIVAAKRYGFETAAPP